TVNDATTWIAEIGASSGHATANRQLTNARAAINWARRQELIEVKKNPFERVERFKDAEQPRERYLRPDVIQRLMYELDRIPQQ
ncbi:hypothetical protein, partial [Klebsiella pneumoniae]|uniref:hypothetical protein n=1 Tax=Klebsiella pneumoniae TaxID=573 RepID=UPI001C6253A1